MAIEDKKRGNPVGTYIEVIVMAMLLAMVGVYFLYAEYHDAKQTVDGGPGSAVHATRPPSR